MALDSRIPLGVEAPRINSPFETSAAMQQLRLQQQAIQSNNALEEERRQRTALLQSNMQDTARTKLDAKQIHDAAQNAYQQINDGNADAVLATLPPETRQITQGWLNDVAKGKQDRAAAKQAEDAAAGVHAKNTAKMIQALGYDPVVAATSIKLLSDLYPEAGAALEHVTDPTKLKTIVDHFATLGDKPAEPFTLTPGQTRFDATGAPVAQGGPKPIEPITPYQAAQQLETQRHNRATEAQAGAALTQGGQGGQDAKEAVAGMKAGTLPPMLPGRASKEYVAMLAESKRQGYDLATAATDWNATQKHVATLNNNQQTKLVQSIQTAAQSVDVIDDLAKQWDGGKFPSLNAVTLKLAKGGALGPKAQTIATQLDGQITDVTSELAQVYMGGGTPTDQALKLAQKNLESSWSKKTLLDMTDLTRKNLQIRANSMRNVGVQGASDTNPYAGAQGGGNALKPPPTVAPASDAAAKAAALLKKYGG